MKTFWTRLALAAVLVLAVGAPAHAAIWDFSWVSEWRGRVLGPGGEPDFVSTTASGRSTATITPDAVPPSPVNPDSRTLRVNFETRAGLAHVNVDDSRDVLNLLPGTQLLPFNVPAGAIQGPPGFGLLSLETLGTYTWTGNFQNPVRFEVVALQPGSGPSPQVTFRGSGTRRSVSAPEPGVLVVTGAGLGSLVALRIVTRERLRRAAAAEPAPPNGVALA